MACAQLLCSLCAAYMGPCVAFNVAKYINLATGITCYCRFSGWASIERDRDSESESESEREREREREIESEREKEKEKARDRERDRERERER